MSLEHRVVTNSYSEYTRFFHAGRDGIPMSYADWAKAFAKYTRWQTDSTWTLVDLTHKDESWTASA